MPDIIRVGVVGVGALGKEHARIYAELSKQGLVRLEGVADVNREAARVQAERLGVPAFGGVGELAARCDALSVVTPTTTHFAIASELLSMGRHVLVEKPMTSTAEEAGRLVEVATRAGVVLQVGHVERFNPVLGYLEKAATDPRFIECHRLSPYPARSTDIGVVLDLMIHDLDVVLSLVRSRLASVEAVGMSVLSSREDIANARLRFANGCVANLTASRISPERLRKIRVFSGGAQPGYISLDYRAQEGFVYRLASGDVPESSLFKKLLASRDSAIVSEFAGRKIVREPVPIEKDEPLKLELRHFIECVEQRRTPRVSGAEAQAALEVAFEITRQIGAGGGGGGGGAGGEGRR